MNEAHTAISSIGEFGLIDQIKKITDIRVDDVSIHKNLIEGIGDDAAVFQPTMGKVQLFTTDALIEGIHFDLTFTSFNHLGWKAMAENFSDIAAMGGVPRYATMTIALPKKISVEMVHQLYAGATSACKQYSCLLVGGDTTASLGNMMISVSVIGEADKDRVIYRHGAQPGDLLCVTGHLGCSLAGLKILQREKNRFINSSEPKRFEPNLAPYAAAIEKHLMPKPRLDISKLLTEQVKVTSMIDISDGLASEVQHLCKKSLASALVYEHNLPVIGMTQKIAEEFNESPTVYALYGGEEYELLFTISNAEFKKLESLTTDVTIIGRMNNIPGNIELVKENGESQPLYAGGWNHFA